jgi:hypothetical protein
LVYWIYSSLGVSPVHTVTKKVIRSLCRFSCATSYDGGMAYGRTMCVCTALEKCVETERPCVGVYDSV